MRHPQSTPIRSQRIPGSLASSLALSLALLLGLAVAPPAAAQDDVTSLFGEVLDVRVINLEVVVTQDGKRVQGLGPEDFVLTIDGTEVPIEYFTEVHGGTAVLKEDEVSSQTVPAWKPGKAVGTSYLVFIDEYFTIGARRNRVLKGLRDQLAMLTPEDRMAIVAYNGKDLEMLSTWSQSVESLDRTLEHALERPSFGAHLLAERRAFAGSAEAAQMREANTGEFDQVPLARSQLSIQEEQQAEIIVGQVQKVVLAAAAALRSFANPPGRKVMLMMAGGWPFQPSQWVISDPTREVYTTGISYGDNLYGPLIETANRLSYTLYPIDVPLEADQVATAGEDIGADFNFDPVETVSAVQVEPDAGFSRNVQAASAGLMDAQGRVSSQRSVLRLLAWETGGRPLLGDRSFKPLGTVLEDTRNYYWVGFTPQWKGDDADHKVDIRPREKGYRVRTRQSFSDLSRQKEVTMMVESMLRLGDAPPSAMMPAEIGQISKIGRGKVEVPLRVLVPMSELTFLPHQDKYVAQAELRVATQDAKGNLGDIPVVPMTITLDEPPREGDMRRFDTHVQLRREHHDLVLSVYDVGSGKILSTKLEVDPEER